MNLFRKSTGMTLIKYVSLLRLSRAQALLMNGNDSILQVAMDSGFGSASAFNRLSGRSPACRFRISGATFAPRLGERHERQHALPAPLLSRSRPYSRRWLPSLHNRFRPNPRYSAFTKAREMRVSATRNFGASQPSHPASGRSFHTTGFGASAESIVSNSQARSQKRECRILGRLVHERNVTPRSTECDSTALEREDQQGFCRAGRHMGRPALSAVVRYKYRFSEGCSERFQ
jgi:AraC-like DNA-binding protein